MSIFSHIVITTGIAGGLITALEGLFDTGYG
jgi:hypothetical protein